VSDVHQVAIIGTVAPGSAKTPALRYWRTRRALYQEQIAERAHVGVATVQRGEAGRPLRLDVIGKLAEVLGVEPDQLMDEPPRT
jgi:transcriptional regulator with XRE-family HTH domain